MPRPRRFRTPTDEEVRTRAAVLRIIRRVHDPGTLHGVMVDAQSLLASRRKAPSRSFSYRTDPDAPEGYSLIDDGPAGLEDRRRLKKHRKAKRRRKKR